MNVDGKSYRTVWFENKVIYTINQPKLPHSFEILKLSNHKQVYDAIKNMLIRGAPAIGAVGCFGLAQAIMNYKEGGFKKYVEEVSSYLKSSRPTAYDLTHGINHILKAIKNKSAEEAKTIAEKESQAYADNSAKACRKIGEYGNELIKDGMKILTHCNAGALATVDYGTALAPIRIANEKGKKIFVFVDETRPRCQGSRLTAWELLNENIEHAVIADNAAGYYMKEIDLVIVGSDRIASNGDIANKIGTYEKAVLAKENNVPFYVAAPISTIDFDIKSGDEIPIEERNQDEVLFMFGMDDKGNISKVRISPKDSKAKNPAFDVTPAKYIKGMITEKGIFKPEEMIKLKNFK